MARERRIRFDVYDQSNPNTLLTTLSTDSDRSWTDVLNDTGSGKVTVHADDAQATDLDCRNIIRCLLDGVPRFAWIIESRERNSIPRDGKSSSKLLTASGRGVLGLMESAVVEAENGAGRLSPPTRLFNFASKDYTEGPDWGPAIQIKRQGDSSTTGQWDGAPIDFNDSDAYWIWGRTQAVYCDSAERTAAQDAKFLAFARWGDLQNAHIQALANDTAAKWTVAQSAGTSYAYAASSAASAYSTAAFVATGCGYTDYATAASAAATAWTNASAGGTDYVNAAAAAGAAVGSPGYAAAEAAAIVAYNAVSAKEDSAAGLSAEADMKGPPPQPVGRCYFRKTFNVNVQMSMRFFLTADDGFELYLDGALLVQDSQEYMWAERKEFDAFVDVGEHLLAVVGVNIERDSASTNVAGFILSGVQMTEGGNQYGGVIVHTDSTWSVLDYPAEAPTMTPGEILRVLLDEAQARGTLSAVSLDFDDDFDSNGAAWDAPVDLEFRVGTSYLQVLHTLIEMSVDVRMTPTYELQMFNRMTLGSDLTTTTELEEGVHLSELRHKTECPIMNVALLKIHTGAGTSNVQTGDAYIWSQDGGGSVAANGKLEAYVELGTAPSTDQANRTMRAVFDDHAYEQVTVSFTPEERGQGGAFFTDERPYAGWQPGDVVLVPGFDDLASDTTVLSLTVSDDPTGGPDPVFRAEGTQTPIVGS